MKLRNVIKNIELRGDPQISDIEVSGVAYDSRKVKSEELFVAIKGEETDGNRYVGQAIDLGAKAVLSENQRPLGFKIPWIQVDQDRRALAQAADNFYSHPTLDLRLIGITGTNGKTSTSYLIESILKEAGMRVGLLGTVGHRGPEWEASAVRTTPESSDLQRFFRNFVEMKCSDVVVEVSSHALMMERVYACRFRTAVFMNLTPDHLDYHNSMHHYFNAKRRLFFDTGYGPPDLSIINLDDPWGKSLSMTVPGLHTTFSLSEEADFQVLEYHLGWTGTRVNLKIPDGELEVTTCLVGRFNLSNLLAAVAVASSLGLDRRALKKGIEKCRLIPGRFERINCGQEFHVIVDYAHTPDALENVLKTARQLQPRKLLILFGCGGDRDQSKRSLMGSIAEKWSDFVMVTSDNPRSENPLEIILEIQKGFHSNNHNVHLDRLQAIRHIIKLARKKDVVILAGKGHESEQQVAGQFRYFDDRQAARMVLQEMGYGDSANVQ
tara:strand:+ start:426 stop:1907 length:1482 start_codon:yes stop_codon:yes gene_type:complete